MELVASRRRKLAEVAGLAPTSCAGLARIVDALRDSMPSSSSRTAIRRAIDSDLRLDTPCGPVLQPLEFEGFNWRGALHPGAMLSLLCYYAVGFSAVFRDIVLKKRSSPVNTFKIICYCDEATAGNLLRVDQTRKATDSYICIPTIRNKAHTHTHRRGFCIGRSWNSVKSFWHTKTCGSMGA